MDAVQEILRSKELQQQQKQWQAQQSHGQPLQAAQQLLPSRHWEFRERNESGLVPAVGNSVPRPSTMFAPSSEARSSRINPAVPDLTGQIRLQHWRPSSYGGQADVYMAFWDSPNGIVNVAVKAVRMIDDPDGRILRRFQREISVWRKLAHTHVQPLFGLCSDMGPLPAMISQWHSNGDIVRYVKSMPIGEPWLAVDTKYRLLVEVLEGLTYLHSKEVIHGDLKGANVLIGDDGSARLCDFGLAAALTESSVTLTQHTLKGTCRWMAPELLADDNAEHTKATDIWAFGGLCIEVLGGVPPYHTKKNDQQVILALARQELPERPDSMERDGMDWGLVQRCCERHPGDRSAADLILQELRVQRMVHLPDLSTISETQQTLGILEGGVEALVALARRASWQDVRLHVYPCHLIHRFSKFLEHHREASYNLKPYIGVEKREIIVSSLWFMLFACIRHAANEQSEFVSSRVGKTASVALRAIQAFGSPFNPPHAPSSLDLQPLRNILPPDSVAILRDLAYFLRPSFPTPIKRVPIDANMSAWVELPKLNLDPLPKLNLDPIPPGH